MNVHDLLQLTSFLIVFISLMLAFFLFTVKSDNRTGNYLLAFYLLINAISVSSFFYHRYFDVHPTIEMLRIEIGSFLPKPLLFLFVLSIIYSNFQLKYQHLVHLIPMLISTIILLPNFYITNLQSKILFFDNHARNWEGTFSTILAHFQSLFYIIAIFTILVRYKRVLNENFSKSNRFNLNWLLQLNIILTFLFVVATTKNILKYYNFSDSIDFLRLLTAIVILIFTCWLVLKALYAPKIFKGIDSHLQLLSNFTNKRQSESAQNISKVDLASNEILAHLKEFMFNEEPFLDPELTIQNLADQLKIDSRELSITINQRLNQNFYQFISGYRISKAIKLLELEENKKLTVLEILYQVGFNSKSSFNKIFKEATGMTPTQFRKQKS